MNINTYMHNIRQFAIYPDANSDSIYELMYLALGLGGEVGEVQGKIKKLFRDEDTPEKRGEIEKELGDVVWYWARLCDALGFDPEFILDNNYIKLLDRKKRGVLGGSGDNR